MKKHVNVLLVLCTALLILLTISCNKVKSAEREKLSIQAQKDTVVAPAPGSVIDTADYFLVPFSLITGL